MSNRKGIRFKLFFDSLLSSGDLISVRSSHKCFRGSYVYLCCDYHETLQQFEIHTRIDFSLFSLGMNSSEIISIFDPFVLSSKDSEVELICKFKSPFITDDHRIVINFFKTIE